MTNIRMQKTVDYFKEQLIGLRGSISQALIETIKVKCYGQTMPIRQVAVVSEFDKGISVAAFDPATTSEILQVIKQCGFNAYLAAKNVIGIPKSIPTPEEKEKVIKQIRKMAEEAKTALRNIRRERKKEIDALPDGDRQREMKILDSDVQKYIDQIDKGS